MGAWLSLLAGALLAVGPPGPVNQGPGQPPALVVRDANIAGPLPTSRAMADLSRIMSGRVDLVVVQEWQRRGIVQVPGWATYTGPQGPRARVALWWRPGALRLEAASTRILHRSTLCRSCTRTVTIARYRVRATGRCLLVVGVHLIPGIQHHGRITRRPRGDLAARYIRRAGDITYPGCRQLIVGDWNMDHPADRSRDGRRGPWHQLHHVRHLAAVFPGPTLYRRAIDGAYTNATTRYARVLPGHLYTDHRAIEIGLNP